jgi:hypothetical protein
MDRRVRMDSLARLQLKTYEHVSKEPVRWKHKNVSAAHFESLARFLAYAPSILYSRFGTQHGLQTYALGAWALPQIPQWRLI